MTKSILKGAGERLSAREFEEVLIAWGERSLRVVENAMVTDWLPAEHQIALDDAMHQVLGGDALCGFHEAFVQQSAPRLLGSFLQGVTNLFGEGSRALVRALPKAWTFVTRDLGHVETRNLDGLDRPTVEVAYVGLPPQLRHETFVIVSRGGQLGTIKLISGAGGSVETLAGKIEQGHLVHRVSFDV